MLRKKILTYIYILQTIFLFLPTFTFYLPFLKSNYAYFYMILYLNIILTVIIDHKHIIYTLKNIISKTPLIHFIILLILIILNSILLAIFGVTTVSQTFRSIIMQIILRILPLIFGISYYPIRFKSFNLFMKMFICGIWVTMVLGFLSYLGDLFNIKAINVIFDFIANARIINFTKSGFANFVTTTGHYSAYGLPRMSSIFEEPALYARYLFLFMPLICSIAISNFIISKNKNFNWCVKKTIMPFAFVSVILTLSPIFLVFTVIEVIVIFYKKIWYLLRKYRYFLFFALIIVSFCFLFGNSYIDNVIKTSYLSRIYTVLFKVHSLDDLINLERSLASRIVNYVSIIKIFCYHPITGVGIGNYPNYLLHVYQNLNISLPESIIKRVIFATTFNAPIPHDTAFIYAFLAEHGIILFSYFLYFYYKVVKILFKLKKIFILTKEYAVIKGVYGCLISAFCVLFYDSSFICQELYVILAIALMYIYKYKTQKGIIERK